MFKTQRGWLAASVLILTGISLVALGVSSVVAVAPRTPHRSVDSDDGTASSPGSASRGLTMVTGYTPSAVGHGKQPGRGSAAGTHPG